jgi:hypothetical protein
MGACESAGNVDENGTGFRNWNRPAIQSRSQRLAVDEGHREERQARGLPRGKNRDDVRVLQICGYRNLALESLYRYARDKVGRENLYHDLSLKPQLGSEE